MNKFLLSAFLILAFCAYYGSSEDSPSSPQNVTDLAGSEIEQRAAKKPSHKRGARKRHHKKHLRADAANDAGGASKALVADAANKDKQRRRRVSGILGLMTAIMKEAASAGYNLVTLNFSAAMYSVYNMGLAVAQYMGIL